MWLASICRLERTEWSMQGVPDETSVCWVHLGDLHVTASGEQNYQDLLLTVREINEHLAGQVDFCVLPGDNADEGTPGQYALIRAAVDPLTVPLHVIPGDHDRAAGSIEAFYTGLRCSRLPYSVIIGGHRCLFLDAVSQGGGGPDFHLGNVQLQWLDRELREATARGQAKVVFVHAYPADFPRDRQPLRQLLRDHKVRVVDMGHTHYNELANDGTTLFATTRSTGQIEEGPVGFSVVTLARGIVNWRFKPLASSWPLVMITAPADCRLQRDGASGERHPVPMRVSARAWSRDGIVDCRCRIDDGPWHPMRPPLAGSEWEAQREAPGDRFVLTVVATDAHNGVDSDCITVAERGYRGPPRAADGSDADTLGTWQHRHLLGTRLGPNRNGRQW